MLVCDIFIWNPFVSEKYIISVSKLDVMEGINEIHCMLLVFLECVNEQNQEIASLLDVAWEETMHKGNTL